MRSSGVSRRIGTSGHKSCNVMIAIRQTGTDIACAGAPNAFAVSCSACTHDTNTLATRRGAGSCTDLQRFDDGGAQEHNRDDDADMR